MKEQRDTIQQFHEILYVR